MGDDREFEQGSFGLQPKNHRPLVAILIANGGQAYRAQVLRSADNSKEWLLSLADAVSSGPLWAEMPRATLIVRSEPNPLLGVVGYFDRAGEARLELLHWQLEHFLPHTRYVGYDQAEKDCEQLAARLLERFGSEALQGFQFTAIPRGGFIVLGMLAYVLGLQRSQLEPPHPPEKPLVVVDDIVMSGVRFQQFMERCESRQVVFAHLYSAPELREEIEAREPQVTCLGARDLRDRASEIFGDEYPAWRERWSKHMGRRGYWVGQPDHVCFAWNEPDLGIWNPVTEREERGPPFIPPELCLKNRLAPGSVKSIWVQAQPKGKGPLRPSDHVLFGELEGQIIVGDLQAKESFVLSDAGADMWRAVVKHGNVEAAADELLKEYDVDEVTLRADLHGFVNDLLSRGFLQNE